MVPFANAEVVLVPSWNGDVLEVSPRDGRRNSSGEVGLNRPQQSEQQL
jgi:hypothetical protein